MGSVGRVLFLEGMVKRSGVGGSKTAYIAPYWILPINSYFLRGEGDTKEGGSQAAREDGKGGIGENQHVRMQLL